MASPENGHEPFPARLRHTSENCCTAAVAALAGHGVEKIRTLSEETFTLSLVSS